MAKRASISEYGKLLGRDSWSIGGHARAKSLSPAERYLIAHKAAEARWNAL